ncbi:MAG: efflux RND transporter periplasmic adaptor subunit [Verrucomicrobiota bacterium]
MNSKPICRLGFLFLLIFGALTLVTSHAAEAKKLYTCGMHPQVIQDHPGNCPICGMKLTLIRNGGAGAETNAANSAAIAVDAATQQNMNIRTAEVQRGPLRKTIRTVGAIDYNETALADVTTKFKGWVEKLNVDATGQLVHRGEPMFEIYSPELYNAQSEFLLALNSGGATNNSGASFLRESAMNKLKYFDVPDAQIAELEKTRKLTKTLPVVAPMSGFVIEKNVVAGQMVDAGMRLYRLADLGIVWVIAQVYEQDLPFVKLGQEAIVKVASLPDREFRGRVTFIYPSVDEKTRTAKVRLEFENPGYFLKPGMFVSALIHAQLEDSAVLVPESAVLRSGARNTVFVALDGGKFEGRDVVLGVEAENALVQVSNGLNAGERVATSGQFLLDSESQLREAIDKMRGSTSQAKPETHRPSSTNGIATTTSAKAEMEAAVYVCPMPEHVSIVYDHAGSCPICNMALVPVAPSVLQKIQPGGKVLYYTCPMPEHASVHEDKPGKCPLCAMTLIPVMAQPAAKQLYTCPMHPEIVSDKPGLCPKCEMDLVPVKSK